MNAPRQIPNRYEFKYVIPERVAEQVREAVAPFCALDRHSAVEPDRQYVITSLYFDTPERAFHQAKVERQYHRLKLRVRTYGELSDGPVFMEVKRKIGDIVAKGRARVPREAWDQRLRAAERDDAAVGERDFRMVMDRYGARPTLLARYRREAHISQVDAYARVTFDRRIAFQPCPRLDLVGDGRSWTPQDDALNMGGLSGGLVLELKATTSVPRWMGALVRRFELMRTGFSKYCTGVERLFGGQDLSRYQDRIPVWSAWSES